MSNRVLQAQEDALSSFQENIQPGRIGKMLLYFVGTNAAGQTGDFSNLGNVTMKRNGETIVNRPVNILADKGNILKGSNLFSSAEAGAFVASVNLPLFVDSFEQALQITGPSELNFEWTPAASAAATFSDMQIYVYAEQSFLDEEYDYFLLGDDQTPGAAVTARPYQLNAANIASLYITDPSGVLTSVGLRQNGEQIFSDQPKNVLIAGTLYENRLEQTTIDMIELQTYTKGQGPSLLNKNTILELTTSGTGTITVTRESIRLKN